MDRLPKDLEHTLHAWIRRAGPDTYKLVREVFPGDTPAEHAHRRNCRELAKKGYLEPKPEPENDVSPHGPRRKRSTDQTMTKRFRPTT